MRKTAHDSLREIVSYVSTDNPTAAEKLGSELLDQALSLESLPRSAKANVFISRNIQRLPMAGLEPARPFRVNGF